MAAEAFGRSEPIRLLEPSEVPKGDASDEDVPDAFAFSPEPSGPANVDPAPPGADRDWFDVPDEANGSRPDEPNSGSCRPSAADGLPNGSVLFDALSDEPDPENGSAGSEEVLPGEPLPPVGDEDAKRSCVPDCVSAVPLVPLVPLPKPVWPSLGEAPVDEPARLLLPGANGSSAVSLFAFPEPAPGGLASAGPDGLDESAPPSSEGSDWFCASIASVPEFSCGASSSD